MQTPALNASGSVLVSISMETFSELSDIMREDGLPFFLIIKLQSSKETQKSYLRYIKVKQKKDQSPVQRWNSEPLEALSEAEALAH